IPNYRLEPTGHSVFSFWEVPAGQPPAIRAWFYPGDLYGQEFTYPKDRAYQLASYSKTQEQPVVMPPAAPSDENAQRTEQQRAEAPPPPDPAPPPAAVPAEPTPEPAAPRDTDQPPEPQAPPAAAPQRDATPSPAPSELPRTASNAPLIGLAGLVSLA